MSTWRRLRNPAAVLRALHQRERQRLRAEIAGVPGLLALLMKPRNGQRWSAAERASLRQQLRGMRGVGVMVRAPGSAIILRLLARWLDRRQTGRLPDPDPPGGD